MFLTMDQLNYSIDYSVNALKRYNNVLENSNDPLAQALKEHEIKLELTEKDTEFQKLNQYVKDELALIKERRRHSEKLSTKFFWK